MNNIILAVLCAAVWWRTAAGEPQTLSSHNTMRLNSTATTTTTTTTTSLFTIEDRSKGGASAATVESRVSSLLTHLPTLRITVLLVCVLTAALITCLVVKIIRSGRRLRKTRKYDIITTPAERVEMAPLNDDHDDEDDSTLFDVKYR